MAAYIKYSTGVMCFTLIHFVAWAFSFVATPTAQFQIPDYGCYTMWGMRKWCGDIPYDATGVDAFGCSARASTMKAGAAFGVMAAFVGFVAMVLAVLLNTRLVIPPVIPFVMSCFCILATMISWACVASVHTKNMCGDERKNTDFSSYTAGFALMVASWGLEIIAVIVLGLTSWTHPPKKEEEGKAQSEDNQPIPDEE